MPAIPPDPRCLVPSPPRAAPVPKTYNSARPAQPRRSTLAYGEKFNCSGRGPAIGVSNSGPGPSGSVVTAPPEARNAAICSWAETAIAAPGTVVTDVRNVCGFVDV